MKNFWQQLFNTPPSERLSEPKQPPKPYQPLSDGDYEYLFSQLLEGIAYGWQPGRIQRFFNTLGERGDKDHWLSWLERYGIKVLVSPASNQELAQRMVKLGEQTQSLPENSPVRKIGDLAESIGVSLLSRGSLNEIWEYNGDDSSFSPHTEGHSVEEQHSPIPLVSSTLLVISQPPVGITTDGSITGEIVPEEAQQEFQDNPELFSPLGFGQNGSYETPNSQQSITVVENSEAEAEDPEVWFRHGIQCYEMEDFTGAVVCWDNAIARRPNYYQAWSNRGLALKSLQRPEEALESYDRAIELESNYDKAWYNRGIVLVELKRYEEALVAFDRVLELNPKDYKAWYNRGNLLQRFERIEEALESYDRALSFQTDLPEIWYYRGNALARLERHQESITSYDRALELHPNRAQVWFGRGNTLVAIGSLEQAIASYDRALQLQPDGWEIWLSRSEAARLSPHSDLLLTSLSAIAQNNALLNQRGEVGELASLEAGLNYLYPSKHPEGWGQLHAAIGRLYARQGRASTRSVEPWYQAVSRYNEALTTLTEATFPEVHLQVLQDLLQAQLVLEKTAQANKLQQRMTDLLQRLLETPQHQTIPKKKPILNLNHFHQLSVDLAVQSGEFLSAIAQAEWKKTDGWTQEDFSSVLSGASEEGKGLTWQQIQQWLDPTTAIVYWHLSPIALTTFIFKADTPEPIVLGQPGNVFKKVVLTPFLRSKIQSAKNNTEELSQLLEDLLDIEQDSATERDSLSTQQCWNALQRLTRFENWLEHWFQLLEQPKEWRKKLPECLTQLSDILEIPKILQILSSDESPKDEKQSAIQHLVLVPHCDLHHLPLPALFHLAAADKTLEHNVRPDLTLSCLPSLHLGQQQVAAISNPDREKLSLLTIAVRDRQESETETQTLTSLANPEIEAAAIGQYFAATQHLIDRRATRANVIAALKTEHNLLHLNSYVRPNPTQAQEMILALGGDDPLSIRDIDILPSLARYKLATLAVTELPPTASTRAKKRTVARPEALFNSASFVRALLGKGVTYVLNCLWRVDSMAGTLFTIEFYRRFAAGTEPTEALQKTQHWMRTITHRELVQWYFERAKELSGNRTSGKVLHEFRDNFRTSLREVANISLLYTETLENNAKTIQENAGKMESSQPPYAHPYYWAGFTINGNPLSPSGHSRDRAF
ncbi:CHAT domain-containing protein [Lusitaniella coriacea]|uniref:CHAT domain-containing protein n=1 Tax=Lusitaniella coriacea TaxID=1983105 RepID=UPI003CF72236